VVSYFCTAILGDYAWGRVVDVLVLAVASLLIGVESLAHVVTAAISVVLVVIAPVAILSHLVRRMALSTETFLGAVCVYLLIAQLFSTLFVLTAIIAGQPFFVQTSHPSTIDFIHFSFVTMTTVGYGDLTSALSVGRMVAMIEAVFGQLYLITVVSLVVQNLGTKHQERREAGEPPGD